MKSLSLTRVSTLSLLLAAAIFSVSCGGGGGGGGGGGDAIVARVTVAGIGPDLVSNGVATQPVAPIGASPNSSVRVFFDGPVDPASLPANGPAVGSIRIARVDTSAPAQGTWSIESANGLSGNVAVFTALPPTDLEDPCSAGFDTSQTENRFYTIFIADSQGGNTDVVLIGGQPVSQAVSAQFGIITCDPANPTLIDPTPGPPIAIPNTPATLDDTAPMVAPSVVQGAPGTSRIIVDFNEPVLPNSVDSDNVFILNTTANGTNALPVAIQTIQFDQFGTLPGVSAARLTITTGRELPDGDVFELSLQGVTDLGNNTFSTTPGQLLFTVIDQMDDTMTTFTDDFTTTDNLGEIPIGSAIEWAGTGQVSATFPLDVVGTGTLGAGSFTTSMTINTQDFMFGGQTVADGAFNFTTLALNPSNAPLSFNFSSTTDIAPGESNFTVKLRATGNITIGNTTQLNCAGRAGALSGTSGNAGTQNRLGGWGGPGGGAGGTGSPNTNGTSSPIGGPGFGANIVTGNPNMEGGDPNQTQASPFYGGGTGGMIGTSPATSLNGSGGGGGTAANFDGDYTGIVPSPPGIWSFSPSQDGETQSGGTNAPAAGPRGPFPAAMMTPLATAVAGSGGGAGGDRFLTATVSQQTPASGGGGGGGGLRISAGGSIAIGDLCLFNVRGGDGGNATIPGTGRGGGGAGGSILMQTFETLTFGTATTFQTRGGTGGGSSAPPLDGSGGNGGDGVVQLEDTDVATLITASTQAVVTGEFLPRAFQFVGDVSGVALSNPIDTNSTSTNYLSASSVVNPGPTGMIEILVRGIAEDPNNPGQPATTMTSPEGFALMTDALPLANINQINGYRYFRFEINASFPPPPVTQIGDPLPFASMITVTYEN